MRHPDLLLKSLPGRTHCVGSLPVDFLQEWMPMMLMKNAQRVRVESCHREKAPLIVYRSLRRRDRRNQPSGVAVCLSEVRNYGSALGQRQVSVL